MSCDHVIKNFLNPEGHQNPISVSKLKAILLKGWIWPIGGAQAGVGLPCSLPSRLVLKKTKMFEERHLSFLQFSLLLSVQYCYGDVIEMYNIVIGPQRAAAQYGQY